MKKIHFEILQWLDTFEKGVKLSFISKEKKLSISEVKTIMEKDLDGLVYEDDGCWFTNVSGSMLVRKKQTIKNNLVENKCKSDDVEIVEVGNIAKKINKIEISNETIVNNPLHYTAKIDRYIDYIKTTKGYFWLKMKIFSETPNQLIVSNFNKLNELNPRQYSIDGEHKLTIEILLELIKRELQNKQDDLLNHQNGDGNKIEVIPNNVSSVNSEKKDIISDSLDEMYKTWLDSSFSFHWLYEQFEMEISDQEIISLFNANHFDNPQRFSSHDGTKLSIQKLLLYRKEYCKIKQKEAKVLLNCGNRMTAFHIIEEHLSKVFSETVFLKNGNIYIDYPNTIITVREQNDGNR